MATEQPDYPYQVITDRAEVDAYTTDLEPGAIVIDSEHDVLQLREVDEPGSLWFGLRRWHIVGGTADYRYVSVPAVVLVHGWGPDDYPEDWEELGGEPL